MSRFRFIIDSLKLDRLSFRTSPMVFFRFLVMSFGWRALRPYYTGRFVTIRLRSVAGIGIAHSAILSQTEREVA